MTIDIPGSVPADTGGVEGATDGVIGNGVDDNQEIYDERDRERVIGLAVAKGDLLGLGRILEDNVKTEEGQQFVLEHQINTAKIADALGGITGQMQYIFILIFIKKPTGDEE